MANARRVVIEFIGQDKSLGSTAAHAENKTSRLGDTLKKVGKVGALALAAGAVAAGKALFDMTKMAIEDQKAQDKLAVSLMNSAHANSQQIEQVEEWISAQGRALGVTDDELRPALQRLVEATGDVGEAQKLASLAMDVSAGTGKSLKTVSEALMKAQNGQISGLSRLGIETTNAKGETLSFEEATQKMADTFQGHAFRSANTLEGKMGRLKLIFDETREEIGAKLIPIVTKLADWFFEKGLPAIQKFGGEMAEKLKPAFESVKDAVKDSQPLWEMLGKFVVKVFIPVLGKLAQVVLPIVGKALRAIATILEAVGKAGKWMWNNALQPVFRFIVTAISKVLTWFGKMLQIIGKAPKMGWVGDLGDKLVNAGNDADGLADSISKIPDNKTFTLKFNVAYGPGAGAALGIILGGKGNGRTVPGDSAPSSKTTASAPGSSLRMAGSGSPIIFTGPVYGDPRSFAQFVIRELKKEKRNLGGQSLGLA